MPQSFEAYLIKQWFPHLSVFFDNSTLFLKNSLASAVEYISFSAFSSLNKGFKQNLPKAKQTPNNTVPTWVKRFSPIHIYTFHQLLQCLNLSL